MEFPNEFLAITEASNKSFAHTRLAVSTFIRHNLWFDGTVLVLTLKSNPLSELNIKSLKLIYSNLKIVEIPDENLLSIKNRIYKKGWDPDSLLDYLYLEAFKIKSNGSLYFSRNVFFQKEVSYLLDEYKLVAPIASSKYPDLNVNSTDLIDHALMYIPSEIIKRKISLAVEQNLLNLNIFEYQSKSRSIMQSLCDNSIRRVTNQYLISSSSFHNSKYNEFVRYHKGIYAVKMNTYGESSSNYSRIHTYWNHLNKQEINRSTIVRSPSELNQSVNYSSRRIKNHRLSDKDLKFNSGKDYDNLNIALCTICNDDFIDGARVMLYSFLRHNSWFKGKIIVYYNNSFSPLSEKNMNLLRELYDNIEFKLVDQLPYSNLISIFIRGNKQQRRLVPSLFTFEVFSDIKYYDKILYLDSDMVVTDDISEVFSLKHELAVTPDAGEYIHRNYDTFNGGFLFLNNSISSKGYREKLIKHAEGMRSMQLADQTIMNSFFQEGLPMLSIDYNCLKRCFSDSKFSNDIKNVKIIHYVGEKPWKEKVNQMERNYSKVEEIWKDELKLINGVNESELNIITNAADIPKLKLTGKIMSTNWGISKLQSIDYYICSTPENQLINEIILNKHKVKNWYLTDNLLNMINPPSSIELFSQLRGIGKLGSVHVKPKNLRLGADLPTSGAQMIYLASNMNISKLRIFGINLYTVKDKDGNYKRSGTSAKENPYTMSNKPHSLRTDVKFIHEAFKRMIDNGVEVESDSPIINQIFEFTKNNLNTNQILNKIS